MSILNIIGTLKNIFSMGSGADKVDLRTNSGVLEGRNNGGDFKPLLNIDDFSTSLEKTWSSNKISDYASDADNLTSGTLNDARLSSLVTLQGNTFNGVSQLVKTTSAGYFPALNGSLITSITASQIVSGGTAFNRNFETDTNNIKADGNVSVGVSNNIARADHVHPIATDRGYSGSFVEASNSSTQSIPSGGVATKVTFPTESQDRNGEFSSSRFTSNTLQIVEVYAQILWSSVGLASRSMGIMIYKNGSEIYRSFNYMYGSIQCTSNISVPVYLSAGDYVEIYASNGDSSSRTISMQKLAIRQLY